MNSLGRNLAIWVIIAVLLIVLFQMFPGQETGGTTDKLAYSEFVDNVTAGAVRDVDIQGNRISGHLTNGAQFTTYAPSDATLVPLLTEHQVTISA